MTGLTNIDLLLFLASAVCSFGMLRVYPLAFFFLSLYTVTITKC